MCGIAGIAGKFDTEKRKQSVLNIFEGLAHGDLRQYELFEQANQYYQFK